jgi:ribosome-dependent ATPase
MRTEINFAVELRDVVHRYGRRIALDNVSLAVESVSSIAVVGPDGVGKSTLLGLIAGARRLQSGDLLVLDGEMGSASHRNRISHRVAYMPQGLGRNLYPSLSVFENLDFFGRLFGVNESERHWRIERLLKATGLDPFPDRPAGKLSGGMKQKLSLCSALIHDPDVLILDEPTTGIDPLSRRQFWSLIDRLKAERPGMTVIVSTAYMEEAGRFERIVAMDAGRLLIDGSAEDILATANATTLEDAFLKLRDPKHKPPPRRDIMEARPEHTGPTVIEAEGLTRRFGDFVAVDKVSFRIRKGEIFGFLGSNGCGKTTTMKMLTGLLSASEGSVELFGRPVQAADIETRLHIGYMSQTFSLYEELSVKANLELHARLYRIPSRECEHRVAEALSRFDITQIADEKPRNLPLGLRQRLQLAAACLHRPEILILDEPTSGVDPEARDMFWGILLDLSRREGVTIFISTHFMNEAERCDRVSLMHAGKLLAVDTPKRLAGKIGAATLEDAFIAHLERLLAGAVRPERPDRPTANMIAAGYPYTGAKGRRDPYGLAGSFERIWAFARREMLEISRDRVRIAFALIGPLILLITLGYGITFDVDRLDFAVFDRDQTTESRLLVEQFTGSRYFHNRAPITKPRAIDNRLRSGELHLVMSVPPRFGKDLLEGRRPEVGFFLDGSKTFRAATARGYVHGIMVSYAERIARQGPVGVPKPVPFRLEERFRYNQDFKSAFAIVPGSIMMLLALIPAMMAALGVVREREIGSISNLYCSPATLGEFIIGKQLPYIVLGLVSFLSLIAMAMFQFDLSIKGSAAALLLAGLLYVFATTALGLFISSFVRTQIAALIVAAVICVVPSVQFSGYLYPAATLEGFAYYMGHGFPALWFQNVNLGVFAKGQGFTTFFAEFIILFSFGVGFLVAARLILRKQGP